MNRDLELVLEQCKGVVKREIPLLVLAPEYTKILLDYIEQQDQIIREARERIKETKLDYIIAGQDVLEILDRNVK